MSLVDCRPALRKLLIDNTGIQSMVSGRIFPVIMAQGERRDSIVYNRVSAFQTYKMDGPTILVGPRYQFDAWSQSVDSAVLLADMVKEVLSGFHGRVDVSGNSPGDAVTIQGIFFSTERDDYDNDSQMYRMSRDYLVWYEERNA